MPGDTRVLEMVAAVRTLHAAIRSGDPIDEQECTQIMDQIQDLVPSVSQSDVELLKVEVDSLILLVVEMQQSVSDELKRLQHGRKGLEGYNHIRGFDTQQRLSRTA